MPYRGPAPDHPRARRIGGWLPRDPKAIADHVNKFLKTVPKDQPLCGSVQRLADLIDSNVEVRMLFTLMLLEVPVSITSDPSGDPALHYPAVHATEIRDVSTLLKALSAQITSPILYNDSVQIGTPINAILAYPMATASGYAAFLRRDVNDCIKDMLNEWGNFLKSEASVQSVTTQGTGWISETAQTDPSSPGLAHFIDTYEVPDKTDTISFGFTSWDQFFTRRFLPTKREVVKGDSSKIANVAESTPFSIQENVKLQDTFWGKDQNYSLVDMLGNETMAQQFVGGTIYQAFLSADSYHNWHAPVTGHYLTTAEGLAHGLINPEGNVQGTYYSEPALFQFPDPDPGADAKSQGYISCVAKRGVAYIKPDDDSLGLIALVVIGMAEVSSIDFDPIMTFQRGDMIGRFHFGGSTHCLIFQPGIKFTPVPNAEVQEGQPPVPVRSELGTLTRQKLSSG